jgi:hypothetical protein
MKRVEGSKDVALMECTNPRRNKWRARWDVQVTGEGSASYMEAEFDHRPTADEVKNAFVGWCNDKVNTAILSGFTYEDATVWLSTENQFNYKAAYDLAVQTAGKSLPVKFKFGSEGAPVYKEFGTLEALSAFYTAAMAHVQSTLEAGWKEKDAFDVKPYKLE